MYMAYLEITQISQKRRLKPYFHKETAFIPQLASHTFYLIIGDLIVSRDTAALMFKHLLNKCIAFL